MIDNLELAQRRAGYERNPYAADNADRQFADSLAKGLAAKRLARMTVGQS